MKNRLKILMFLAQNKGTEFSIKEISEKLGINYRIAFEETKALAARPAIAMRRAAGANLCSFAYAFNELAFQAEEARKEALLKDKNIKVIYNRVKEIQDPFYILLVFGSYAAKTQAKTSDIDLCIITDSAYVKNRVKSITGQIPLSVHLVDFTKDEFLAMLKTRTPNVGHEILKNNVILKGIEEFYELVNYFTLFSPTTSPTPAIFHL